VPTWRCWTGGYARRSADTGAVYLDCECSFADLDGLEFVAKIDVERDDRQGEKNVVKGAVGPEHKDYAALMHGGHGAAPVTGGGSGSPLPPPAATRASVPTRPAWAQ